MVAPSYLSEMLQQLLSHLDSNAYAHDNIPYQQTFTALRDHHLYRKEIVEAILLRWFGKAKGSDADERHIALRSVDVVRYIGLEALRESAMKSSIKMVDFINDWESKIGPTLHDHIKVALLTVSSNKESDVRHASDVITDSSFFDCLWQGHHLIYPPPPMQPSDSNPLLIEYFAASSLALDPATRMQQLFQKREQWTIEHLGPFLDDVAIDSKKRDAILLKHARTNIVKVAITEDKKDRKARLKQGLLQEPTRNVVMYSSRLRHN